MDEGLHGVKLIKWIVSVILLLRNLIWMFLPFLDVEFSRGFKELLGGSVRFITAL